MGADVTQTLGFQRRGVDLTGSPARQTIYSHQIWPQCEIDTAATFFPDDPGAPIGDNSPRPKRIIALSGPHNMVIGCLRSTKFC